MWRWLLYLIAYPIALVQRFYLCRKNARLTAERDRLWAEMKRQGIKLTEEDKQKLNELRTKLGPNAPPAWWEEGEEGKGEKSSL